MKIRPSLGEILVRLDAAKWEKLTLPLNCDRTQIKREVQNTIFWFTCGKRVRPDYDLESLRSKVRAARELLRDHELLDRLLLGKSEKLVRQLQDIEPKLNASIRAIERERRAIEYERGKPDVLLTELLCTLIVLWKRAGGSVGGGAAEGRAGGPLVRFLKFAAEHVGVSLTPNAIRHRMRHIRKKDLDDLSTGGGGEVDIGNF
jgi:hypothetical protein